MTPEILSTIGYNLVGIAIGAGTVVGAVVKPFQRKLASKF